MAVFLSVFLPRSKDIQELTELLYPGFPQVTVSSVANAWSIFQSGEGDFFVISLKAGGTGLNLTSADYVILLDP